MSVVIECFMWVMCINALFAVLPSPTFSRAVPLETKNVLQRRGVVLGTNFHMGKFGYWAFDNHKFFSSGRPAYKQRQNDELHPFHLYFQVNCSQNKPAIYAPKRPTISSHKINIGKFIEYSAGVELLKSNESTSRVINDIIY
eukprot:276698_1